MVFILVLVPQLLVHFPQVGYQTWSRLLTNLVQLEGRGWAWPWMGVSYP
jgi:hypothetical protein